MSVDKIALAEDRFRNFYQEKLWEMIPSIYRHEDGLESNPNRHVLRALVEVMAEQAAILRRSQDRLWEDQFIEWCDDWAVPYIGDLVGTKLLSALNKRGRRIDVAKTIYYRRRKGTPRILEELITDISGWEGKLVEGFRHLARARHGLDPLPHTFSGRYTQTPPGGTADLRCATASELSDGPFEEYFHTPDLRKPKGLDGRYGITKLNFYLYRLTSFPVMGVTPFMVTPDYYTFDPSGRSIHLFSKRNRFDGSGWDQWHSAEEWELPQPIRCRLLGDSQYMIDDSVIAKLLADGLPAAQGDQLHDLEALHFKNESSLRQHTPFLNANFFNRLVRHALIEGCGKFQLIPLSLSVTADAPFGDIEKENITSADLTTSSFNSGKLLGIDPVHGRFEFLNPASTPSNVSADYHYGFSGRVGAGTYDRRAVEDSEPTVDVPAGGGSIDLGSFGPSDSVEVQDNSTYQVISSPPPVAQFVLQASNQMRPYLILNDDLVITSAAGDATLVLDGLWLGCPGDKIFSVRIQGDFECIEIRNCTFDPGHDVNANSEVINPVALVIEGVVEKLIIEASIMGPLDVDDDALIDEEICITDSIIQAAPGNDMAVLVRTGITRIIRSTIFGETDVHRLYATDSILTGIATVVDTQAGCFRFSAAPKLSRIPRPYESFLFKQDYNHWFTSRLFGHYGYAQLSATVPPEIFRGGENGAEMGVFNSLINAIRYDGLSAKVGEYMPFGLIPNFINIT